MIVWTIFREGDGPMKAYRTLGDDLKTNDPKTANSLMTSMASSFVRSCIANSELEKIIKERDDFRMTIIKGLKP